jgi:predicted nucleotidyltransferase
MVTEGRAHAAGSQHPDPLGEAVSRLARALGARRIVLFGSRARGEARLDSDYDLAVIAESDLPWYERERQAYRALRGMGLPIEVVVLTSAEMARERDLPGSITQAIEREGKVLYDAAAG